MEGYPGAGRTEYSLIQGLKHRDVKRESNLSMIPNGRPPALNDIDTSVFLFESDTNINGVSRRVNSG